jgi:hypothetical protein
MSYEMRGMFLEACDCRVVCPCWFDEEPDDGSCTGLIAWHVEQGDIDAVHVSGLSVASVSHHTGHRRAGNQETVLFIDEQATAQQEEKLYEAFTGGLGGPLGELTYLYGRVSGSQRLPITFQHDGQATRATIGFAVTAEMIPLVGRTSRLTTLADTALSYLLSPLADVGKSSRYEIRIAPGPFNLVVQGRSASRGRFTYRSAA